MTRRTRILLLILAGILYCCSMACNASVRVEAAPIAELANHERHTIAEETSECYYNPSQGPIALLDTPDEALPIARVQRTVQTVSPTKVVKKDRIASGSPCPQTVAQAYQRTVTSYLQYSNTIFVSLPPEEIAFPFVAFW